MTNSSTGQVNASNPHLKAQSDDVLYHFGLSKNETNFPKTFGDVKFVCTGGSPSRIKMYAHKFSEDSGIPVGENLSKSDRFVMFKTGPILWVNHGMGVPSMSIMLNEVIKLMHYAGATDVSFIRIGTSGGIDVTPGSVVVSSGAMNGLLNEEHIQLIHGQMVKRPAKLDSQLAGELFSTGTALGLPVVQGKTLCADDFYEGQMRLDGAFCEYDANEKFKFLQLLKEKGVRNIEMEATGFASFTHRANVKGAIICVALLNRLNGDQVDIEKETYIEYEMRPFKLVSAFLRSKITEAA